MAPSTQHPWELGLTSRTCAEQCTHAPPPATRPRGTVFCQVEGLDLVSTPQQRGFVNGHRGVWWEHGSDNMMRK